jgi:hypothetical protein
MIQVHANKVFALKPDQDRVCLSGNLVVSLGALDELWLINFVLSIWTSAGSPLASFVLDCSSFRLYRVLPSCTSVGCFVSKLCNTVCPNLLVCSMDYG